MIMLTDISGASVPLARLSDECAALGREINMSIHVQHEDLFNAMHKI